MGPANNTARVKAPVPRTPILYDLITLLVATGRRAFARLQTRTGSNGYRGTGPSGRVGSVNG